MRSIEISLKEILVYVLYKWLPILFCTVIVGGLMGGYTYRQQPKGAELVKITQQNQAAESEANQSIDRLNKNISEIQASIEEDYSEYSSVNTRIVKMAVDISYDADSTDIKKVKNVYTNVFKEISLSEIFEPINREKYTEAELRKLVTIIFQDINGAPTRFIISAVGSDGLDPVLAVDYVLNAYMSKHQVIIDRGGEHEISPSEMVSIGISSGESLFKDEINKKHKTIDEYKTQIAALNDVIAQLKDPAKQAASKVLTQGVIGAVIGLVIGVIATMLVYIFKLPILTSEQIQNRLDIRYLGGIRRKKGFGLANKVAGDFMLWTDERLAVEYVAANLAGFVKENETVLLTGSVQLDVIKQFAQVLEKSETVLNVRFVVGTDVTTTPGTIKAVLGADHIVLVERLNRSTLKKVYHEADTIREITGKEVAGYVLY